MIGVRFPGRVGIFSLHHLVLVCSGAHSASYPMSIGGSFPEIKRPVREANQSPPSSAEVNECAELYHHSPVSLHGVVLS
jgi:hypothetical protein